jgi:hypothetical protein
MRMFAVPLAVVLIAAGCGRDAGPADATATASSSSNAQQPTQARVGDVTVHASVVQTSTLDDAVARQYGLERSDRIAMLLVSARRDGDAPLPPSLKIEAGIADPAGGAAKPIALHPVTVDGLTDYLGTVDIAPTETLRFDVSVTYGTARSSTQFTRDFYPR